MGPWTGWSAACGGDGCAMPEPLLWLGLALALVPLAATLSMLTALLERSGPIRLRHWAEEAGSGLRDLYARVRRFEAFRYLVSLLARLSMVGLYGSASWALAQAGVPAPLLWGALTVLPLIGAIELGNRYLVGHHAEAALRRSTLPLRALSLLVMPLLPVVAPLLPRERRDEETLDEASEEEIAAFIDVGRREGILEPEDVELLRGLVGFGDTQVRSVMTPRVDLVCAPVTACRDELVELFLRSGHSRIPLYEDSIDRVVGILHVRDLLRMVHGGEQDVRPLLQHPHFVPETKSLGQLLKELQELHQEVALVVDEYGGIEGLVSIEDLLEEVFGELADEHDREAPEELQLSDGSWRIDGRTHLEDLEELLDVEILEDDYETVGGLIFGLLGHVPRVGDVVEVDGLRLLVEGADHRRARRVRVSRLMPLEESMREG
jgi:CBS domain containing-hemolysin-like protein